MSRVLGSMLFLFFLLIGLRLHGFSLASWEGIFSREVSLSPMRGQARGVRSDDWMAQLPAMISQSIDEPRFSGRNHLIHPSGHEMLLGMNVPVKSWIALFKPTTWGYFIDPDFGLAWHWQFRIFLLLGASFLFFSIVMGASSFVAGWGALCLAASSFFAYWSYISEPITSLGLLSAVLILRQLRNRNVSSWELPALYWVLVSFCVNNLYPPFQVPMIYFVAAFVLNSLLVSGWSLARGTKVFAIFVVASATLGWHIYENLPVLQKILGTEYPGLRISTGGDLEVGRIFLLSFLSINTYGSFPGLPLPEAASSYFVGLVGLALFAVGWKKLDRKSYSQARLLTILSVALAAYCFVGIPETFAQASGWSLVPAARTLGLWTLLNICWLVWWMEARPRISGSPFVFWTSLAGLLLGLGYFSQQSFAFLGWSKLLPAVFLMLFCAFLLLGRPKAGMLVVLVILLGSSLWFNPIDRRSHARIMALEEVQTLKGDFAASGKRALLLLDGDPRTANFLRLVGIPGYGGMHFVPQLDFWKTLDPSGANSRAYNRFAHVVFVRAPRGAQTSFENPQADVLKVSLSEDDLARLSEDAWIRDRLF